jgi:acyl-CoA thioesterase-1
MRIKFDRVSEKKLQSMNIHQFGFMLYLSAAGPVTALASPPFWSGPTMTDEPLLFVKEEGSTAPSANLLFNTSKDFRLVSPDGKTIYQQGRDYLWQPGSHVVTLTAQSAIPFKTHADMFPPVNAAHSFGVAVGGKTGVLWSEGTFFHDLQPLASYTHDEHWMGAVPPGPSTNLERALLKLRAKQSLKIVVLGDSISAGYNSSSVIKAPPFQPSYSELFATNLQERFGAAVMVKNLSVSGQASAWAESRAPQVVAEKPDLVVLAFGMNDQEPAPAFLDHTQKAIDAIRAGSPEVDFIIVSSMAGNPDLEGFSVQHFVEYRDALKTLAGRGVAVADVTSVWMDMVKRKTFSSMTGNGVNHPNDLGHRVYANVLEALFPEH